MKKQKMNYCYILFICCVINMQAQTFKKIDYSATDTTGMKIEHPAYKYHSGKIKETGAFRYVGFKDGAITLDYIAIGRHVTYRRNGKIKDVETYTLGGLIINDTTYRRNGAVRLHRVFKTELSYIESNGKALYFCDRFYTITFYYKNGKIESEGLGERTNSFFMIREDTWNLYNKDGTFKCQLTYKPSGINQSPKTKTEK